MNEGVIAVFIPIAFFIALAIVIWKWISERSRERMTIIEKGVSGDDLKHLLGKIQTEEPRIQSVVKWAFIAIGIGLAILLGIVVDPSVQEETVAGLIFVLPGLGLLLYYFIFRNKKQN